MIDGSTEVIPWFIPHMTGNESKYIDSVLKDNYLNDGNRTREFESKIADFVGTRHAVAVTNATSGLALSLMACDVKPGDEVIVPDFTFIATANAVSLAGATPVFADVDPDRMVLGLEAIKDKITSRTKSVITVEVNGRSPEYKPIHAYLKKNGISLITDSAESLGSRHKESLTGCFGDAGVFSFSPNKTITTGQGGLIVTSNDNLFFRLRQLKDQGRRHQGTGGDDMHPVVGYNFKLTNLQAAVGLAQFEDLENRLSRSRERHILYQELLQNIDGIKVVPVEDGEVTQWTDIFVDDRAKLANILDDNQIGYRFFWNPLHTQTAYPSTNGLFPNSTEISSKGMWLPSSYDLSNDEIKRICAVIYDNYTQ